MPLARAATSPGEKGAQGGQAALQAVRRQTAPVRLGEPVTHVAFPDGAGVAQTAPVGKALKGLQIAAVGIDRVPGEAAHAVQIVQKVHDVPFQRGMSRRLPVALIGAGMFRHCGRALLSTAIVDRGVEYGAALQFAGPGRSRRPITSAANSINSVPISLL